MENTRCTWNNTTETHSYIQTGREEKRGGQWGCEEAMRLPLPPLTAPRAWTDVGGHDPSLTMAPTSSTPLSPPPLQTPDFAHQPLHTLCHMQRDLVTLGSNTQVCIQVATQASGPEEQQSTVLGLPLAEATAVVLPAVTSASFFCGKASLVPTSWEGPTTVHPPPITPGQKQRFSGWARNRAWGFPSSPKAETAQQLQVKTHFSHLTSSPSRKN